MRLKAEGFRAERLISFRRLKITPIPEDVYLTDIGFFPNAQGHFKERYHGSNENILIFCANGVGYIEIFGMNIIKLNKNELYIIPKNTPHKYYSSKNEPWSIYWVHYNENLQTKTLLEKIVYKIEEKELQSLLKILFFQIINILELGLKEENLIFSNHTLKYLLETISYLPKIYDCKIESNYSSKITLISNYIEENMEKKICLEDFSRLLDCSKSHTNKIFLEEFNLSPMGYVTKRKLEYAENLLKITRLSITEISNKIGIGDSLYFSKCFKKKYKMSPLQYRNALATIIIE